MEITWYVNMPVLTLKDTIISSLPVAPTGKVGSCTNQYMASAALSSTAPIHLALVLRSVPLMYAKLVRGKFPFVFSITPTSEFSVEPILTFIASMYSPSGSSRSSTTLFILPATKFLVSFAILFNLLVHASQVHQESSGMNVANSNLCVSQKRSSFFTSTSDNVFLYTQLAIQNLILNVSINVLLE